MSCVCLRIYCGCEAEGAAFYREGSDQALEVTATALNTQLMIDSGY
jgi:hypothetical protein